MSVGLGEMYTIKYDVYKIITTEAATADFSDENSDVRGIPSVLIMSAPYRKNVEGIKTIIITTNLRRLRALTYCTSCLGC